MYKDFVIKFRRTMSNHDAARETVRGYHLPFLSTTTAHKVLQVMNIFVNPLHKFYLTMQQFTLYLNFLIARTTTPIPYQKYAVAYM